MRCLFLRQHVGNRFRRKAHQLFKCPYISSCGDCVLHMTRETFLRTRLLLLRARMLSPLRKGASGCTIRLHLVRCSPKCPVDVIRRHVRGDFAYALYVCRLVHAQFYRKARRTRQQPAIAVSAPCRKLRNATFKRLRQPLIVSHLWDSFPVVNVIIFITPHAGYSILIPTRGVMIIFTPCSP